MRSRLFLRNPKQRRILWKERREIRREKVFIPPSMTTKEIREKYGLKPQKACNAKRKGFFVKNYSRKQVIIDESRYDPHIAYGVARKVFRRNFLLNPVAISIREDLIQEAVTRMYELSGKAAENEKYSVNYYFFWVAHNAMHSFLKTWERQMRYYRIFEDSINPIRTEGRMTYHPAFGWIYC